MASNPPVRKSPISARALLVALIVLAGSAWNAPSAFASATIKKASHHNCKCATHCKGSKCCCPSDELEEAPEAPRELELKAEPTAPATSHTNPCMRSSPCGQPDMPHPNSAPPVTRLAALGVMADFTLDETSRVHHVTEHPTLPALVAARIDDPPESSPLA